MTQDSLVFGNADVNHYVTFEKNVPVKKIEALGGALIDIVFELGQSKQLIERRVYGLFDWMNEVGGFFGFMQLLFQIVLPFCQIWSLEKFLIQKLYR